MFNVPNYPRVSYIHQSASFERKNSYLNATGGGNFCRNAIPQLWAPAFASYSVGKHMLYSHLSTHYRISQNTVYRCYITLYRKDNVPTSSSPSSFVVCKFSPQITSLGGMIMEGYWWIYEVTSTTILSHRTQGVFASVDVKLPIMGIVLYLPLPVRLRLWVISF